MNITETSFFKETTSDLENYIALPKYSASAEEMRRIFNMELKLAYDKAKQRFDQEKDELAKPRSEWLPVHQKYTINYQ